MRVNYSRVHLLGSAVIGCVIALAPTVMLYKIGARKLGALIFLLPAAILATWLVLWMRERAVKEHADSVRRRHKAGRPAVGQ